MEWFFEGNPAPQELPFAYGFTYKIIFKDSDGKNWSYYGKKSFYRAKTQPPLQGYKRKRRSMVESDWRTYNGSSSLSKSMEVVSKEILSLANSMNHLSYLETKLLFEHDVLYNEDNLNANIGGKYYDNVDRRSGKWLKVFEGQC